eukprot:GHVL01012502.1.p1 GENE.GHVL01012502.1~~GHVL01012502.1.p1  ORF type:complete len:443 (-),score=121.07 GHVL01012502.1:74-1402(-)
MKSENIADLQNSNSLSFSSMKRLIGRTREEALAEGNPLNLMGVTSNKTITLDCPYFKDPPLTPEKIATEIIKYLITKSETILNDKITKLIISVPAHFNAEMMRSTKAAAENIGTVEKVRLIREPVAAALAYGLHLRNEKYTAAVLDLGGGTFDVSFVSINDGMIYMIGSYGDRHLGGNDFDMKIAQWIAANFIRIHSKVPNLKDPRDDAVQMKRLLIAAEKARIALTDEETVRINISNLYQNIGIKATLTRAKMESLCSDLLSRIAIPIRKLAVCCGYGLPGDEMIEPKNLKLRQNEKKKRQKNINPFEKETIVDDEDEDKKPNRNQRLIDRKKESKRYKQQSELRRIESELDERVNFINGSKLVDTVLLVGGASRMQSVNRIARRLFGVNTECWLDPDHAVALGASIEASILDGSVTSIDVTSQWRLSLLSAISAENSADE